MIATGIFLWKDVKKSPAKPNASRSSPFLLLLLVTR